MKKKFVVLLLFVLILALFFFVYYLFLYRNYDVSDNDWFVSYNYIGHALYGIDGYSYTNSKDSLELGYKNGIRVMEVDLLYTSDNQIVANHFWENSQVLSYKEFMNEKKYNQYTSMDLKTLIVYMLLYKDLYIVIDTKEDSYSDNYLNIYKELVEYCLLIDESLLERIVIQLYNYDMYDYIEEIYDFNNYIFTIYKLEELNILKLTNFCIYNDIDVIAFPEWVIDNVSLTELYIKFIKSKGLWVYVYTVNDIDVANKYYKMGVDGIYTDFIN